MEVTSAQRPPAKAAARRGARRRRPDPAKAWARRLSRGRPGLVDYTLGGLASVYGRPIWKRRHDPTSELVLTILTQNSADVNAEKAYEALRARYPSPPVESGTRAEAAEAAIDPPGDLLDMPGWGGVGIRVGAAPDWMSVETAPLDELVDVIRPGGLAPQKAPRIQAALRQVREQRGDHSLEFLGDLPATEALAWLTSVNGIGVKTASVVLLFCFGMPLMPVDRHVERVAKRIGLLPSKVTAEEAHAHFLALLEPDQVYEAHVNLITHGRRICTALRPAHERCPVLERCRFVDRRAP